MRSHPCRCALRPVNAGLLLLLLTGLASCGGKVHGAKPVYPTKGTLFYQGQPATGAIVVLHPLAGDSTDQWPRGYPTGVVAEDGSYQIQTYNENDGAPEGEYAVLVLWTTTSEEEEEQNDKLQGRYADAAKSTLRAKVDAKPTEIARIDLK